MKAVFFASLLTSAAAFAPAQQSRSSTELCEFAKGYVGGEGPEPMFIGDTGSKNFDPLGIASVSNRERKRSYFTLIVGNHSSAF